MSRALAEHDERLLDAIHRHRGAVFSHGGDGVAAVFARAGDAVAAAVDGQRALTAMVAPIELGVRMGVHTGEAVERDGSYFGPAVNRAARLMALAGGGQVLA